MQLICMRPKWICLTFFDARFLSINWDANRIKCELNLAECSLSRSNRSNGLNCEIVKAFTCQSHFGCIYYVILNLLRLPAQPMLVDCCRCLGWIIQCSVFTVHLENTNHPLVKKNIDRKTVLCICIDSVQLICAYMCDIDCAQHAILANKNKWLFFSICLLRSGCHPAPNICIL